MTDESVGISLQRTDYDQRVVELRTKLLRAGVSVSYLAPSEVNDPTVFDDHVDAAVRAFQQSRGLLVDGVLGPETERSLAEAQFHLGDRPLRFSPGSPAARGDDVADLQRQLSHLGFYYGHIDGELGVRTDLAIKELQGNLGLEATGLCDSTAIVALSRINRSLSASKAFSLRDYERLNQASAALRGRTIALDPAIGEHTAIVANTDGEFLTESFITYDISSRVAGILQQFGASVMITRSADEDLPGPDRISKVRAISASLSVALHCDSLAHTAANGVSAFYWGLPESNETRSPIGERVASLLLREIVARTGMVDLGAHARSWDVLRLTHVPSVQLELGYLSNSGDAARLADPIFRQIIADSVVVAIQRLYLLEEDDHPTGTMAVDDVERFNL